MRPWLLCVLALAGCEIDGSIGRADTGSGGEASSEPASSSAAATDPSPDATTGDDAAGSGSGGGSGGGEATSASTSDGTTGVHHPACEPTAKDTACSECRKLHCCEELHACIEHEPCLCVWTCVIEGHTLEACHETCLDDGTTFDAVSQCTHDLCFDACMHPTDDPP